MKFFLFLVCFFTVFLIFQYISVDWFVNLNGVRTIFSITIGLLFTIAGFGIADTLKPDDPEEEEA